MINIREIEKHEGYFIGDDGNVYKKMKPWLSSAGYPHIKLQGKHHYDVHRLVAKEFIENPNNLPVVNHINEDRQDNRIENLEWCTQQENIQKYLDNGGTPIKNFIECYLYKGDELITECKSIEDASKLAETLGANYQMIRKHKEHSGFKIVKG